MSKDPEPLVSEHLDRISDLERIEAANRLAEWSKWRGEVDAGMKAADEKVSARLRGMELRMSDLATGIYAAIADLNQNFNRRMDSQDNVLSSVDQQTRLTNGRVTKHDAELEVIKRVDVQAERDAAASSQSFQWKMTTAVGAVSVVFGGAIGFIGHAIGIW